MSRYSRDLYARLEAGDRALHRLPADRPPLGRDHAGAAGDAAPRARLPARLRGRRTRDLAGRGRRAVAAGPDRRPAGRVIRRRRGPGRPGRRGDVAGQGRAAARRHGRRGRHRSTGVRPARPPGHRRGHRPPAPSRRRPSCIAAGHVVPPARRAGRGRRAAAGGRALLPAHRADARASTATCRSSRTRTATATTARRAAACWSGCSSRWRRRGTLDGVAARLRRSARSAARLGPDGAVPGAGDGRGSRRSPTSGIRTFFCGPESFTADVHPMLGPAPEVDGLFVAAGLNSLGILLGGGVGSVVAQWIVDGVRRSTSPATPSSGRCPTRTTRRFRAERTVEQLGVLFGDGAWPTFQPHTARGVRRIAAARPAGRDGRPLRRLGGLGVPRVVRRPRARTARTSTVDLGPRPRTSVRRRGAPRRARGRRGHGHDADVEVRGAGTRRRGRCSTGCRANDVARDVGRVVYTQWCDARGGIQADLTVTRLADGPLPGRRRPTSSTGGWRRCCARETRAGEFATSPTSRRAPMLLSVQGPRSRELLQPASARTTGRRALPLPHGARDRGRLRPRARAAGDVRRRARLRAARARRVRGHAVRRR